MLQMASHNRFKQPLARDSLIIVILTLAILILSGIIGVSTVSLINSFGYEYTASSFGKFEHRLIESTRYTFINYNDDFFQYNNSLEFILQKHLIHMSFCAGYRKSADI